MGDKIYNIENIGTATFVNQSLDYQALVKQIEEKQELIDLYQETGKIDKALKAGAELAELEQKLEAFKENVFRLYEIFTRIEIDTERLAQAKAYFEQGQFREADAILNAAEMAQNLARLNIREQQIDQVKAEIIKGKAHIADEFLIKAWLQATAYDQPDWFEQACEYFEAALKATRTPDIVFDYALFFQIYDYAVQSEALYEEALQFYRKLSKGDPYNYLPEIARTLLNLGVSKAAQSKNFDASCKYKEALQLYRKLANESSDTNTYLPSIATTLSNLANSLRSQNLLSIAELKYKEALNIRRDLSDFPGVSRILNNLAVLQASRSKFVAAQKNHFEALKIRIDLAENNPDIYLPDVAMTLNNMAVLQTTQGNATLAETLYIEALEIQSSLAKNDPGSHLPDFFQSLINLSLFYIDTVPDQKKSIALAKGVLELAQDCQGIPSVENYADAALQVLQSNGVNLFSAQ
ncbi:MAG: tetratricopeptide repeat protein [Cyanobacteria bacterium P01_H01_bin.153]